MARSVVDIDLSPGEARHYALVIQSGLLSRLGTEIRALTPGSTKIMVVTDEQVAALYLQAVRDSLIGAGFELVECIVPPGESSKTMTQVERVAEAALRANLSRKDRVLALGGGVVGDLAGFFAATYHRGMPVIQVPTTLVAQVDSAIGGKTGVNVGAIKNAVGAFHQPAAVFIDPDLLASLPPRELSAGLAEVVKYGLIDHSCTGKGGFFDWLLAHADHLPSLYDEMIMRCCQIKAAVVMQDETETRGLRFFLNLGHTFGHAYESLSDYAILHGEAVAIGLMKAAQLAVRRGEFPPEVLRQLETLLPALGLGHVRELALPYAPEALLACMTRDKKNDGARVRLVLPSGEPGQVVVRDDVSEAEILAVLSQV